MSATSPELRQAIITAARGEYYRHHDANYPRHKACIPWMLSVLRVLHAMGIRGIPQAGSACWRFRSDESAGEVDATHFAYTFIPQEAMMRLMNNGLPEIHAWVGIPDSQEIIDMTTGFQSIQAKQMHGFDWAPDCALPDALFAVCPDELPFECLYVPRRDATSLVSQIATNIMRELNGKAPEPILATFTNELE